MRYLMILLVGVCLLFTSVPAMADQAEDEAAIKKVIKEIFDTWNANDVEAMVALYDEPNYAFTGQETREETIALVKKVRADYKDSKATLIKDLGVIFLKPDVAIQRRITEFSTSSGPDGKPGKLWNQTASVLMKKNGKWLVVAQFATPMSDEQIKEMKQTQ